MRSKVGWAMVAAVVAGSMGCTTMRRLTDDQKDQDASLWLHTPYVSAGDTLELEVGAFDQPMVGIGELVVTVNGAEATRVSGQGRHWGSSITTSDEAMLWEESDWVTIELPVPEGVDSMVVRIEGKYFSPGAFGTTFMNLDYDVVFEVDVPVVSPAMKYLRRAASGLAGLVVLVAVAWAMRRGRKRLFGWMEGEASHSGGGWLLLVVLVWGAFGYWWFCTRIAVFTGWTGTATRVTASLIWLVAPLLYAGLSKPNDGDDEPGPLPRARAR